jgi:hypothetical protein
MEDSHLAYFVKDLCTKIKQRHTEKAKKDRKGLKNFAAPLNGRQFKNAGEAVKKANNMKRIADQQSMPPTNNKGMQIKLLLGQLHKVKCKKQPKENAIAVVNKPNIIITIKGMKSIIGSK